MIKAIFATDLSHGFGIGGGLPWPPIKEDFTHFKAVTKNNYIAMGYNTYKTLPKLKGRTPVVILDLENRGLPDLGTPHPLWTGAESFIADLSWLSYKEIADVCIIGGTSLLTTEALESCDEIHHTTVKGVYEADTYVSAETMAYLSTLNQEILLESERCIIRKYTK